MNLNYEQKYLKYKKKYLNLRNKKSFQKGGAIAEPVVVMPNSNNCEKNNNDPERCNEEKDCMYYNNECRDILSRDEDDRVDRMEELGFPINSDVLVDDNNKLDSNWLSKIRPGQQKVVNWNELPRPGPQLVNNWNNVQRPGPQQNTAW